MTTILDLVADRQASFSQTANSLKAKLDRVRLACFVLSIGGATLAAIAGGLKSDTIHPYLAWPATAMLAIATYMTARLMGPDSSGRHVKARMAAEALKREAFLYATEAPPYADAGERDAALKSALDSIETNANGLGLVEQAASGPGSCPRTAIDVAGYITARLQKQIDYYRTSADKLTKPSRQLHRAEFVLAGAATMITAIAAGMDKGSFDLAALTAVITTLGGTVLSHLQSARYDEQIISYRATAHRLEDLKATMTPGISAAELATVAENIVAAENNSWQALWSADGDRKS